MQRRPITTKFEKSFRTSKILTSGDIQKYPQASENKENLAIYLQTESLARCLTIFLSCFFIHLVKAKSSHSDSLWKCSKCLGSLCELALPERGVSTQDSGEMINTGMQYRFCSNCQLSCDGVTAKLMGNISLNY